MRRLAATQVAAKGAGPVPERAGDVRASHPSGRSSPALSPRRCAPPPPRKGYASQGAARRLAVGAGLTGIRGPAQTRPWASRTSSSPSAGTRSARRPCKSPPRCSPRCITPSRPVELPRFHACSMHGSAARDLPLACERALWDACSPPGAAVLRAHMTRAHRRLLAQGT